MNIPILVQIKTADGLTLPGYLYESAKSKKVAIFLHGNGSSSVFYSYDLKWKQASALSKIGVSYLLFNNRGAHLIKNLKVNEKRKRFGMAYEKIKDCVKDIDAAILFLKKLGYKEFYLIGESTGANKICVYDHYKPRNKISKYILLGGGDDTGIYYGILGKRKFFGLLKESKYKIKIGNGENIICELLPDEVFSYKAFYDIANPDGDYNVFPYLEAIKNVRLSKKRPFRYFKAIKKPSLVVYGQNDQYVFDLPKTMEILKKQQPKFDYVVIKGADHGFSSHQTSLSRVISGWLSKN